MKIYIVKLFCSLFFATLLLFAFTILKGASFVSIVKTACAANWGSSSVCGANSYGAGYELCPKTGVAPLFCVTSSDFHVTINGTGIPYGQKFIVDIAPTDGSGDACNLDCLLRTTHSPTSGWTGAPMDFVFDRIGCSTTGCTNDYTVKVRFEGPPYVDQTLSCPDPTDVRIRSIQNGGVNQAPFTITCQTPTATAIPAACPVPVAPVPVVTCNECTN